MCWSLSVLHISLTKNREQRLIDWQQIINSLKVSFLWCNLHSALNSNLVIDMKSASVFITKISVLIVQEINICEKNKKINKNNRQRDDFFWI